MSSKLKTFKLKKVDTSKLTSVPPTTEKPKAKFTLKKVEVPEPSEADLATLEEVQEKVRLANKKLADAKRKLAGGGEPIPPKPKKEKKARASATKKDMDERLGAHIKTSIWMPKVKQCFEGDAAEKDVKFISTPESVRFDAFKDDWRVVVMSEFGGEFCVTLFYDYGKGWNTKKISVEYITLDNLQHAVNWVLDSKQFFNNKKITEEVSDD